MWDGGGMLQAETSCGTELSPTPRKQTGTFIQRRHIHAEENSKNKEIAAPEFPSGFLAEYPVFYPETSNISLFGNPFVLVLGDFFGTVDCCITTEQETLTPCPVGTGGTWENPELRPSWKMQAGWAQAFVFARRLSQG